MTLTPDKSELAQRIADVLEEKIDALLRFYGSTYSKSDCCKILIEPLLEKNQIDTLLKSLPSKDAQILREKYSRLMSCFDKTGELIDQDLPFTTIERHVTDPIKELRNIGQQGKQRTTTKKLKDKRSPKKKSQKTKLIKDRFTFRPGQVLFDNREVKVGTGAALEIIEALVKNFGRVVPFQKLDGNSSAREGSEKTRTAIVRIRKEIKLKKVPVIIESRKAEEYIMLPSTG